MSNFEYLQNKKDSKISLHTYYIDRNFNLTRDKNSHEVPILTLLNFFESIFFSFRDLAPLSTQKVSYVSFENIDNLEVYLTDLDSGDKTVVTEDIDFLSLGLLESHRLNIANSESEISSVKKDKKN